MNNNQPVVLNIQFTPYKLPSNATQDDIIKHAEERRFYNMSGGKNVYKYITTEGKISSKKHGQASALEYLQKSTGVFNGGGMISAEEVERMKERLAKNTGHIWHGFISLNQEQSHKIDTPEKCIGLVKETFGSFLSDAHFSKDNIDLMCALHLDKPHHLHIHFVFWEKEPKYKGKGNELHYKKIGIIDKKAIDNLFVRVGLYVDENHDRLYETRVEAIRTLREMTSFKSILHSTDEIKKAVTELAKDLPKTGRIAYGSKDMESFRGRVDKIVDMLLTYDGQARRSNRKFYKELENKERTLVNVCGKNYLLVDRKTKNENYIKELPKYHNEIDIKNLHIIEDIEFDYRCRQGNLVLKLAKNIKPEIYDKTHYKRIKVNDTNYKRRSSISNGKISSLFSQFLRSFVNNRTLLERDFSHRLQDIEREMEEKRKEEERKEANYKY